MKVIKTIRNKRIIVDDEDFDWLNQWKWNTNYKGYAYRIVYSRFNGSRRQHKVFMARFVIKAPVGLQVDHINRNKLDNRKSNLRLATNGQNQANSGIPKNNTSGYKGVTWNKKNKKWVAQVECRVGGKRKNHYLGGFSDIEQAVLIRDKKVKEIHGEFAYLNKQRI